jgi:hypothetical protein
MFAAGILQPSKMSSPVLLAWRPIFSSIRPMLKPGVSASTMNALIFPESSSRSVTAVTM